MDMPIFARVLYDSCIAAVRRRGFSLVGEVFQKLQIERRAEELPAIGKEDLRHELRFAGLRAAQTSGSDTALRRRARHDGRAAAALRSVEQGGYGGDSESRRDRGALSVQREEPSVDLFLQSHRAEKRHCRHRKELPQRLIAL